MDTEKATGSIVITKVPAGEAPENVRIAWLGLTLPAYPLAGYVPDETGTVTAEPRRERAGGRNRRCYIVPQDEALAVLAASNPSAACWWREHGYPQEGRSFAFGIDEADIVEGVRHQTAIAVTEEMMGDPYR